MELIKSSEFNMVFSKKSRAKTNDEHRRRALMIYPIKIFPAFHFVLRPSSLVLRFFPLHLTPYDLRVFEMIADH